MSDYTPTTESVRTSAVTISRLVNEAEFDRWLAAYTAEKQAEALEQFADDLLPGESGLMRVADVIRIARDAAQRLRGQATNQRGGASSELRTIRC